MATYKVDITNKLPFAINYSRLNGDRAEFIFFANADSTMAIDKAKDGETIIIQSRTTGAFVTAFVCDSKSKDVVIGPESMTVPGQIGPIPKPSTAAPVPSDGLNVVVGSGSVTMGVESGKTINNTVIRSQYWQRMPDSFSLFPQQKEEISITTSTGMQNESSTSEQIAESINAHAGVGWGPVSAGLSASLSTHSSSLQQITVKEQTQTFRSKIYENTDDNKQMYFVWQLTEEVIVIGSNGEVASSLVSVQAPAVIDGPYNPDSLPAPVPLENRLPTGALVGGPVSKEVGA